MIGWILLLSFLFAATDVSAVDDGVGYLDASSPRPLGTGAAKLVILIATRRPAVLRRGRSDQRLADVVRVLA